MSYEVNDKAGPRSSPAIPAQAPCKSSISHRGGDGCVQGTRASYRIWWVITLLQAAARTVLWGWGMGVPVSSPGKSSLGWGGMPGVALKGREGTRVCVPLPSAGLSTLLTPPQGPTVGSCGSCPHR